MERINSPVGYYTLKSTLINAVRYNDRTKRLDLYLFNGQIRQFSNVPPEVVIKLVNARSPGRYYMKVIRNKYPRL